MMPSAIPVTIDIPRISFILLRRKNTVLSMAINPAGNSVLACGSSNTILRYQIQLPLICDFSADPLSGLAPLEVNFTDTSTGNITSWEWDFDNDGTIDSDDQDPLYTYTVTGLYTVVLTVGDGINFDTETNNRSQ